MNCCSLSGCSSLSCECGGNESKAARRLGLSRTQLDVRLRKYDIDDVDQPAA